MIFTSYNPSQRESGFTLVELLVVIAIIAILTAIAVPAFLHQRQKAYVAELRTTLKNVSTFATAKGIERGSFYYNDIYRDAIIEAEVYDKTRYEDGVMRLLICATEDEYVLAGYHNNGRTGSFKNGHIYYIGSNTPLANLDSWDDSIAGESDGRKICGHVLPSATNVSWAYGIADDYVASLL